MIRTKRTERYRSELRAEILAAARELILEEGYDGLTIRKLAQRMEYSPMALYSYFADKHTLLTTLALEGFEKLAKRLEKTTVRGDPFASLRKMLLAYIAYADANPVEYRILFLSGESASTPKKTKQDLEEGNPAFRGLFRCVKACVEAGLIKGDVFAASTALWTAAHGAATVLVTQQTFPFGSHRRYAEEIVAIMMAGIQHRPTERI